MDLFNPNGKLFSLLTRIFDLVYANFLFLLTSLPIVTLGASLTALNRVTQEIVCDELNGVSRCYFHCFRSEFRTATGLWLLLLSGIVLLVLDWLLLKTTTVLPAFFQWVSLALLILVSGMALYSFQLTPRFESRTLTILRNSLLLTLGHFPYTVALLAVPVMAVILLLFVVPSHAATLTFFLVFIGSALYSLLCSAVMIHKIFPRHHTKD